MSYAVVERFKLKIGNNLETAGGKRNYTEKVFSEVAHRYDLVTRILSFWRDAVWKKDLASLFPSTPAPFCVDLATGTGDIAFLLARKYPHGRIVGVDIARPMLDIALGRNRFQNVFFTRQDMAHLEFPAESVDIITGGYALRNAPNLDVALDEIRRVLKPGGIALFLDFSKPASPSLQKLEYNILKMWGGFWGLVFHRNHEVYSYIAESLKLYPDRRKLRALLRGRGFTVTESRLYFLGITELLSVRKTSS